MRTKKATHNKREIEMEWERVGGRRRQASRRNPQVATVGRHFQPHVSYDEVDLGEHSRNLRQLLKALLSRKRCDAAMMTIPRGGAKLNFLTLNAVDPRQKEGRRLFTLRVRCSLSSTVSL